MACFIMATGAGLISGVPNTKNDFTVYGVRHSTTSELYVGVGGPGGCVPTKFLDTSDKNAIKVVYVPSREGVYRIEIKFAGVHVRGSPFKVPIRGRAPQLTLEEKASRRGLQEIFDTLTRSMGPECSPVSLPGRAGEAVHVRLRLSAGPVQERDQPVGRLHSRQRTRPALWTLR